jgi:hypothetical protein
MEFAGVKRWKVMVFTEALELFELGGSGFNAYSYASMA